MVVGIAVLAALALLVIVMRRRRENDDYWSPAGTPEKFKTGTSSFQGPYPDYAANLANPQAVVDQRLNPAMLGDPRISIASLADARDYSRQILKVANPDEKL